MRAIISLLWILLIPSPAYADEKLPTIGGKFEVTNVSLPEAIASLNKVISAAHPGRRELLVAYVEAPHGGPENRAKIRSSSWTKDAPIRDVIDSLVRQSLCHYREYGEVLVIYGWHEGAPEK